MLDFDTQQLVQEAVLLKASNNEMFTAHDVTRAIRAKVGRRVEVSHADVRDIVHEIFTSGVLGTDYARTLANFPGVHPVPWIYHRTCDDPTTYKRPADTLPTPPWANSPSISVGSPPNSITASLPPGSDLCHVDARETLCIPNRHIRAIKLDSGDKAYVFGSTDGVYLTGTVPIVDYAEYVVDRNRNVRITQGCLQRMGYGGRKYLVEVEGDQVKITKQ